jgi:hypothetical protein
MTATAPTATTKTRYGKGVQKLRPELVEKIRTALTADPNLSKSALARAVGVSRQTVVLYLKALPEQTKATAQRNEEIQERVARTTHLDLIDSISRACEDVNEEIKKLRAMPASLATSSVIFKGFGTLERLWRLLGEVLGQVSPPSVNHVYLTKVDALLATSLDPADLSTGLREALDGVRHGPT